MKTMRNAFFSLLAILAMATSLACLAAEPPAWILGKWELAHDPDGSPKDFVEFKSSGRVISTGETGGSVAGEFTVAGQEVRMVFQNRGKAVPLTMKYDAKKKRLLNFSARTGNTAEYQKLQ